MTKRNLYSADFKAHVALDAIREEKRFVDLSKQYGVHPNMISALKRELLEIAAGVFSKGKAVPPLIDEKKLPSSMPRSDNWLWNGIFSPKVRSRIECPQVMPAP